MEVTVEGSIDPAPFLSARDMFATEFELNLPVNVAVRQDPSTRMGVQHTEHAHQLVIPESVARGSLARELTLHEFGHMRRYEEGHVSHHFSTREAIWLAACGSSVERDRLTQCYQIANHVKDIYADDLTVSITPSDKLIHFLESSLAEVITTSSVHPDFTGYPAREPVDPSIAAVNAAFAIGLLERHDLIDSTHQLYELAGILDDRSNDISVDDYRSQFRTIQADPTEREFRHLLVDLLGDFLAIDSGEK